MIKNRVFYQQVEQAFDKTQKNLYDFKPDYTLIKWLEILLKIIERQNYEDEN